MTELTKPTPRRSPALERALWFGPRAARIRDDRHDAYVEARRERAFLVARGIAHDPMNSMYPHVRWFGDDLKRVEVEVDEGWITFAVTLSGLHIAGARWKDGS